MDVFAWEWTLSGAALAKSQFTEYKK